MFKPSRKKVVKAKEKITFKLEFHATHIPQRGWDKLLVSLVSLDSGKVTSKTGKSPVKNGTCQWVEPLFESALISQDSNGKDVPKELYKLVVSMGLSRFGLLGDTIINLVDYLQATVPVSLSLPLQNCNFGSILHVKIQRMLPKSASRDLEDQKESLHQNPKVGTSEGDQQAEHDNSLVSNRGDAFPLSPSRDISMELVDGPAKPLMEEPQLYRRDGVGDEEFMSLSSSASSSGRHEAESGVYDGESMSPEMLFKPGPTVDGYSSSPRHSISSPDVYSRQNREWNLLESSSSGNSGSLSPNRWETSQRRSHLQRATSVAMPSSWDHDANQVAVVEIEALRQELANEAKRSEEVHKKLSMLMAERDNIKQEMENLRSVEAAPLGGLKWQQQAEEEASRLAVKELQDELDYVKGINLNLSLQLDKTQESNSELLLEIQDLEKLLQEKEVENQESERELGSTKIDDLNKLVDSLRKEMAELERDSRELTEENSDLLFKLKQANDKLKDKDETIVKLETEMAHFNSALLVDCAEKLDVDNLGDDLSEQLRVSEEARLLLEAQSRCLLEKVTKAEDDYANASEIIRKLEAAHQTLEQEKSEAIRTLEKQLGDTNEQLSATVRIYNDVMQVMEGMNAEKAELEVEMLAIVKANDEGKASLCQLQDVNALLEEKLCHEQMITSKVMQQIKEVEAQSLQLHKELNASQAQVKSMEQITDELETAHKHLEVELHDLQDKDKLNRHRIKELELRIVSLEEELHALKASRAMLEAEIQEMKSPKERFKLQEDAMNWPNVKGSRRPLEEKNSEANELLQKQSSDLTWKLSEKEMELQDLKTRVFYLEEELQRKVNALASAERRLNSLGHDGGSQVSYLTRSLSRASSRVGVKPTMPPSREAKELSDLRSKVQLLEGEVKRKAAELEASKEQLKEQYMQLSMRIEDLELANEELVKEHSNSKLDQALKELSSLQSQNAMLFQRENELLSRLASQEALQCEMEILKEEKEDLKSALSKFNAAAKGENILERISTLETELAEVLESNIMYKTQLQSAFAKQQNVHAAALENLGSVDKVINDLAELKRKNLSLEDELCDMKERYFNMSLQFAEVEAEREELVMTIRNLRGTKKFVPLRSAIF
eukprot:c21735_g1_i1 orf=736-4113(+)